MPCSAGPHIRLRQLPHALVSGTERRAERTVQLLVIVRVAEVGPQLMDAVRVEREQVRRVGGIALALQIEHRAQ